MKAKQWIRDYLDFAVPLMVFFLVAGLLMFGIVISIFLLDKNIVVSDFKGYFETKFYSQMYLLQSNGFFDSLIKSIKSEFFIQIIEGQYFICSIVFMLVALVVKLVKPNFTIKNLLTMFSVIFVICNSIYTFAYRGPGAAIWTLLIGIIIMLLFALIFISLKIFFANFSKSRKALYILIIMVYGAFIFINLSIGNTDITYFGIIFTTNFINFINANMGNVISFGLIGISALVLAIFIYVIVIAIVYSIKNIQNPKIIIPQDIKNFYMTN